MRLSIARLALLSLPFLSSFVRGQEAPELERKRFDYQSDVARLRKIVVNSLYSHRDVFLRELVSNANDANEKYRLTSLTDRSILDDNPLNITIQLLPDEGGEGGRIVITDTGIGMTPDELATNLGTLAKSGTSDFLNKAESDVSGDGGNLIGQFGLGFYSSFLVSSKVYVASLPPPSASNPKPTQHVFASYADDNDFEIYPDPRGNTLGRGTEISMVLKDDALEYLNADKIKELIQKHSAFSSSFPIYLYVTTTEEVPDLPSVDDELEEPVTSSTEAPEPTSASGEDDEAVIEDVVEEPSGEDDEGEDRPVPMKVVATSEWVQLNDQPPLWTRDPKNATKEEYDAFYMTTFKDHNPPLAYHHFKGDSGSGVSFKAILFIPPKLDISFWRTADPITDGVRVMVKRTFITSDLAENPLPKWMSWIRAIIDADDLPLNVSRETFQSTRFLNQIKSMLIKRLIALLQRLSEEEPETFRKILEVYSPALKLGAVESERDRGKLAALTRFSTNLRSFTSLDDYAKDRKKGQNQIFYLAGIGTTPEYLTKSVFIEKLHARGYEVLLLTEPMDEILLSHLRMWKGMAFQDVSKKGLRFGDENDDDEAEKKHLDALTEEYKPLLQYLKEEYPDIFLDAIISNRLVTSPCAIVVEPWAYSANMERLMAAQTGKEGGGFSTDWVNKQKYLEINPRSPLIQGLLPKVVELQRVEEVDGVDQDLREELKEATSILVDTSLVRSGYDVADPNEFFNRMDRVLRRSLGVSETLQPDTSVKPAPLPESTLSEDDAETVVEGNSPLDEDEKLLETQDEEVVEEVPIIVSEGDDRTPLLRIEPEDFIHDEL